jgi:putative SOS response-associated peptidase YedK
LVKNIGADEAPCDHVEDAYPELLWMCGRNSLFIDEVDLVARFDAEVVTDGGYTPRHNIAPGDNSHLVTNEAPDEIDAFHWGPIPFWADELEGGIINARSETADEKRVFERA